MSVYDYYCCYNALLSILVLCAKLTFKNHISHIKTKISKTKGILTKLYYLPKNILVNLYYSLIYPYLYYCIEFWGSTNPSTLFPLFVLQKKIVRTINNLKFNESTIIIQYLSFNKNKIHTIFNKNRFFIILSSNSYVFSSAVDVIVAVDKNVVALLGDVE